MGANLWIKRGQPIDASLPINVGLPIGLGSPIGTGLPIGIRGLLIGVGLKLRLGFKFRVRLSPRLRPKLSVRATFRVGFSLSLMVLGTGLFCSTTFAQPMVLPPAQRIDLPPPIATAHPIRLRMDALLEDIDTAHDTWESDHLSYTHPYFPSQWQSTFLPNPHLTSQHARLLTLTDAIQLALRNNPMVQTSELQRVVDKYSLWVAHNQWEPQLSFQASASFNKGVKPTYNVNPGLMLQLPIGTQISIDYTNPLDSSSGVGTLTITQPLLRGFGDVNLIAYQNALDGERINKLAFKQTIINVVDQVIQQYRTLVADYNNLAVQKRILKETETTFKQFQLKYKLGKLPRSELLQQQVTLENTKFAVVGQENSLQQSYQAFLSTLGLIPTAKLRVDQDIDTSGVHIPNQDVAIHLALINNTAYRQAVIQLRQTERALLAAKDARRWQLNATATVTAGNQGTGPNTFSAESGPNVMLNLEIPIDDIASKAAVVDAEIAIESAKINLEQQKEDLIRQVITSVQNIKSLKEQINIGNLSLKLKKQTLTDARIKQQYGRTTVFIVTQIQDELLAQETNLISTKINYLNAISDFYNLLGVTLDEWHIQLRY